MGSRKRRNPLWQHLNPREEQRDKGRALARPPPPAGRFAIPRHTCSWVTVGHASWPLPLRAPPNPNFCSSLPKIAMLCSKVGTRAPEAMHRTEGFLLGGRQGDAWLKQKPLTGPLGFRPPPHPRPCINTPAWLRLPAKQAHQRSSSRTVPLGTQMRLTVLTPSTAQPPPNWSSEFFCLQLKSKIYTLQGQLLLFPLSCRVIGTEESSGCSRKIPGPGEGRSRAHSSPDLWNGHVPAMPGSVASRGPRLAATANCIPRKGTSSGLGFRREAVVLLGMGGAGRALSVVNSPAP